MNPPINDIRQAIPEIGRIIAEVLARQQQPSTPEQIAIRAVWSAVDNTRMHLSKTHSGIADGTQPNSELVQLWGDASLQIAAFNPDLSMRLRENAEY
ncbi:MAG TPA: hypothetical protein VEW46_00140 [Pyrinomonadaceae bacterium]|nr:hypothetical protein [Pyrinomonadaceae bacterium]